MTASEPGGEASGGGVGRLGGLTAPDCEEASSVYIAGCWKFIGARCCAGAKGGSCVEALVLEVEASGAILSAPPGGMGGGVKYPRKVEEDPEGG